MPLSIFLLPYSILWSMLRKLNEMLRMHIGSKLIKLSFVIIFLRNLFSVQCLYKHTHTIVQTQIPGCKTYLPNF